MTGSRGPQSGFNRARVRVLAELGLNGAQIAGELGVSRQRIAQIAAQEGITIARKTAPPPNAPREWRKIEKPVRLMPRLITGGIQTPVNSILVGRISELLAAADLMARGWHVFVPLDTRRGHDLVACASGLMRSFEVRSARRRANGKLIFQRYRLDNSDHYAIVVTGEPVIYEPPLPDLGPIDYRKGYKTARPAIPAEKS